MLDHGLPTGNALPTKHWNGFNRFYEDHKDDRGMGLGSVCLEYSVIKPSLVKNWVKQFCNV
jgi:hypothetical protein